MNIAEVVKDQNVLALLLETTVNGITLSDPNKADNPIVYSNAAFERISGYSSEESTGKNCRFLQGNDNDQENVKKIKGAVAKRQPIRTAIVNYRKNGERFYNEISISPIYNREGDLIYFLGIQHDVTEKVLAQNQIARMDKQIGALYVGLGSCIAVLIGMASWALVIGS